MHRGGRMAKKEIKRLVASIDTSKAEKKLEEIQKKKLFINLDTSAAERQCEEDLSGSSFI